MPPLRHTVIAASLACIALTGCSTGPKDIATLYVSVEQYQAYGCKQMDAELEWMRQRVELLAAELEKAAERDKMLLGVGLFVWPVLLALGGTRDQEAEYAYIKGKYEMAQQLAQAKHCPGWFAVGQAAQYGNTHLR